MAPAEPDVLRLRDGRALGVASYGDPKGSVVLHFHGLGSSRLEPAPVAHAATEAHVRLVVLERPGSGRSDPLPGRTLLSWADDVAEAADLLGLGRFAVLGYSGGGPYALACAYRLPQRLTRVGVLSGLGPMDGSLETGLALPWYHPQRVMFAVAGGFPSLARLPVRWIARMARDTPDQLFARMSPSDRAVGARPGVSRWLAEDMFGESMRRGTEGTVSDLGLYLKAWGFPLGEIRAPVCFFHGEDDAQCPPAMARALAARIPAATLRLFPAAGHFAFLDHLREVLEALVAPT